MSNLQTAHHIRVLKSMLAIAKGNKVASMRSREPATVKSMRVHLASEDIAALEFAIQKLERD